MSDQDFRERVLSALERLEQKSERLEEKFDKQVRVSGNPFRHFGAKCQLDSWEIRGQVRNGHGSMEYV